MPGLMPEVPHDDSRELRVAIEAGPDGSAAQGQFLDGGQRIAGPQLGVFDLLRVSGKLLSEPHGRGVHQMSAANLDDVPEFLRLLQELRGQIFERVDERFPEQLRDGDVDRGGDNVIAGLPHIHMVIRMHGIPGADGLSRELRASIRDDLVRIHVRRSAGSGLINIEREMLVEFAVDDLLRRAGDEFGARGVELAEFIIGLRGGPFDQAHGADEFAAKAFTGDGEIQDGALRGSAIERFRWALPSRPWNLFLCGWRTCGAACPTFTYFGKRRCGVGCGFSGTGRRFAS